MPHDLDDLFADLNAAKANLARSVKRTRGLVGRKASAASEPIEPDRSAFNWPGRTDR